MERGIRKWTRGSKKESAYLPEVGNVKLRAKKKQRKRGKGREGAERDRQRQTRKQTRREEDRI